MLDSHCHLNDAQFSDDLNQVVTNFLSAGVEKVVCVGCDTSSNKKAKQIAGKFDCVYYAVGIHPDDCGEYNENELEQYLNCNDKKLVAVGEIGLDYFHNKENKEQQKQVFISQILLAKKHNLPFIIHCRDAYGDTLEILKQHAPYKNGAVMHCYGGSLEYAKELIKLGIKISFTGTVTYKNAVNVQEVAKKLPDGTFFFETDSPHLTPVPFRGKRNEPKNVVEVAKFVADLRGVSASKLMHETTKTAMEFFKF